MAAPEGNEFWKARATHGRDKIFESPEIMWEAACQYFEWCDNNPWVEQDWVGKYADAVERKKKIPYTKQGLCLFLDIDHKTFSNYSTNEDYKDFFPVTTRIGEVIYNQKFIGASVGMFNANIIARDLGLSDKTDHRVEGNVPDWMKKGIPEPK